MAIRVETVEAGSPAEKLGLQPGDTLLDIDGNVLNDMLDYQFYTTSEQFHLRLTRGQNTQSLEVKKDVYAPFGCDFHTYLADEKHSCDNHCMFCFIDQLPPNLRDTLYFKDDDERLSFLFGNYITMTNMHDHEIDRIIKMRINPINISVHTTNPELRTRMLANKRGGESLQYLHRLAAAGIEINSQLVLCRGVNDGEELRHTLEDLIALAPSVISIAAVPAGLTDYRDNLYPLTVYDKETSAQSLDILEEYGEKCLEKLGTRLVYPSDEWYLCAGRPIPPDAFYEDYAQLENGVGMWRLFEDTFTAELAEDHGRVAPRQVDMVTGMLAAPLLQSMAAALQGKYPQVQVTLHPIENRFFGGNVSVAGLITGTDILAQCKGKLQSDLLCVPEVMLRDERDMFLDNVTLPQLAEGLGAQVEISPVDGAGTCLAMLGIEA